MTTTKLPVSGRRAATYDQLNYSNQSAVYEDAPPGDVGVSDPSSELTPRQPSSQYDGYSSSGEGAYIGAFGLF